MTVHRNLSFQQNPPKFDLAVAVLRARANRLEDLNLETAVVTTKYTKSTKQE